MKNRKTDWKAMTEALWKLLDDIDTLDDVAKFDDKGYRRMVREVVKKREQYMHSPDGYGLVVTSRSSSSASISSVLRSTRRP